MADVADPRINIALARPIAATLNALRIVMKDSLRLRRRLGSAVEALSGQACRCRVVRTMPTTGSP